MKLFAAVVLLAISVLAPAQNQSIKSGSTVYIEPMNGYESYLASAIIKKHVPLVVVGNKETASYIIRSTITHTQPSQPGVVVNNSNTNVSDGGGNDAFNQGMESARQRSAYRASFGSSSASITLVDAQSSQLIFAFSAAKIGPSQTQKTAEDCAKHLKVFIEKSEKQQRR